MKKLISVILVSAMAVSMAACTTTGNGRKNNDRVQNDMGSKPEGAEPEFIETTAETEPTETSAAATTEATTEATTAATTTTAFSFGKASDYVSDAVERSFSEEMLYEDMPMGVKDDGSEFFVAGIASIAGAEWYYHMIDAQGNDLYNDPAWVR